MDVALQLDEVCDVQTAIHVLSQYEHMAHKSTRGLILDMNSQSTVKKTETNNNNNDKKQTNKTNTWCTETTRVI